MPRSYKCLVLKDRGLHHAVKKLAAELDVPMIELVELILREGLQRMGGLASPSPQDPQEGANRDGGAGGYSETAQ